MICGLPDFKFSKSSPSRWSSFRDDAWIENFRQLREEFRDMAKKDLKGEFRTSERIKTETLVDKMDIPSNERKDEPGKRYDAGKLRYDLLPMDAMDALVDVYTQGAAKYQDHNWAKGMSWSRVLGPLLRHISAFMKGESYDKETGCHHMAQAAWNCLTLVAYDLRKVGTDDRYPTAIYKNNNSPQQEVKEKNNESTTTRATTKA